MESRVFPRYAHQGWGSGEFDCHTSEAMTELL